MGGKPPHGPGGLKARPGAHPPPPPSSVRFAARALKGRGSVGAPAYPRSATRKAASSRLAVSVASASGVHANPITIPAIRGGPA